MVATGQKLALGSALRVFSLVATALVSLMIMPFVVHSLGDRMYGVWALAATLVGYYGLLDLGLSSAVSRYLAAALGAGDQEQCNRVYNTSLRIFTALGVVVLLVGCVSAAASPLFSKSPEDAAMFWRLIVLVSATLALSFPIKVFVGILEAHLRYDQTTSIEIINLALRNGLVLIVLLMGFKVVAMAWVLMLATIPISLAYIYYAYKDLPFLRVDWKNWEWQTVRVLLSYSIFALITRLADVLRFQVDAIVVASFVGLAAVTHYRIASALTGYYISFMMAVIGVVSTLFSRQEGSKDLNSLRKTFFFASKISVCVSSFVGFGLIIWGKPFITRWMGPQYLDAYPCLVILVLGCAVALWQTPSSSLLFGISKHKVLALFTSAEALANLVLSLLLVRRFGMFGVAFGTFLPMILVKLFVQPFYVCHVLSVPYSQYFRPMAKTLVLVACSLIVPTFLSARFAAPDYKTLAALGAISMVCYSLPLLLFDFTPTETMLLKRAILPRLNLKRVTG
jgi:O-antigen/teichoic acid export membrane protein